MLEIRVVAGEVDLELKNHKSGAGWTGSGRVNGSRILGTFDYKALPRASTSVPTGYVTFELLGERLQFRSMNPDGSPRAMGSYTRASH